MNQLADSLKTNQIALRYIIQYEVLHKRPIMESYDNFCKMVGNDAMSYPDFEFWFMRFSGGHLDVNYERAANPLTLCKLPVEILAKIVEKLDTVSRIFTRNVSKYLRFVVDNQKPRIERITYTTYNNVSYLKLDNDLVRYENTEEGCLITCNGIRTLGERCGHGKHALTTIGGMMRHPKLKLKEFKVLDHANLSAEQIKSLHVSNNLANVNTLFVETSNPDVRLHILKEMKPGTLETVKFRVESYSVNSEVFLESLMETEQWKQAKTVNVLYCGCLNKAEIPKLHTFPVFRYRTDSVGLDDLVELRNKLQNSSRFKDCEIHSMNNLTFNINQLADALGATIHATRRYACFLPIPNSVDCLLFGRIDETTIKVARKNLVPF